MNEEGETDEMDWSAMGQEDMQDHINDADKLDICPVDNLSYYWKPEYGMLMLRTTETMDADTFWVNYADDLAIFILKLRIGLKKTQENRNYWVAK